MILQGCEDQEEVSNNFDYICCAHLVLVLTGLTMVKFFPLVGLVRSRRSVKRNT